MAKKIQYKDGEIVFLRDDIIITRDRKMKEQIYEWTFSTPSDWSVYEEPKPKKRVTLYRYTYKYGSAIHQTYFTSKNWSAFGGDEDYLLLTESKEVEYDDV